MVSMYTRKGWIEVIRYITEVSSLTHHMNRKGNNEIVKAIATGYTIPSEGEGRGNEEERGCRNTLLFRAASPFCVVKRGICR